MKIYTDDPLVCYFSNVDCKDCITYRKERCTIYKLLKEKGLVP
jgi:hypothetical protein